MCLTPIGSRSSRFSLRYSVPRDNPFVLALEIANGKPARPEVYAYGLRQLWRYSFDRKTGDLWGGEVGQALLRRLVDDPSILPISAPIVSKRLMR